MTQTSPDILTNTETITQQDAQLVYKLLHGHTSFKTALIQDDYPSGWKRCKRAVWIETAEKGAKKGQMRFVYRTTDPDHPTYWNAVQNGSYSNLLVMYLNEEQHIKLDSWYLGRSIGEFKARWYDQLTDEMKSEVDAIEKVQARINR